MTDAASIRRAGDPLAWFALFAIGSCWGLTGPLSKTVMSTGHHPIGVTFWSALIAALFFSAVMIAKRVRPTLDRRHIAFFLICGLIGTAFPNTVSYEAYRHLPVGVNMMILSLIPMTTLLIALPLGLERLDPRRAAGLALGVAAVALIALPDAALPSPEQAIYVALPLLTTLSYAAENIFVSARKPAETGPLTVMWGLSWGAVALLAPLALGGGLVFDITAFGPAEQALAASAALHICAYFGFIWLIGRAGPVFASQVGYVVTGLGVLLGMALFDERHSLWIWAALALMMTGLALVKPRPQS